MAGNISDIIPKMDKKRSISSMNELYEIASPSIEKMKINNVIKSMKNKIIDKLFVKINWSRRVRPKDGDILGLKLFIVLGFLDTIFAILFFSWILYSHGIGTGINILGYGLLFIIFMIIPFRIIYDIHIRNFTGVVAGVIFTVILIYVIYKFHYLLESI